MMAQLSAAIWWPVGSVEGRARRYNGNGCARERAATASVAETKLIAVGTNRRRLLTYHFFGLRDSHRPFGGSSSNNKKRGDASMRSCAGIVVKERAGVVHETDSRALRVRS